MSKEENKSEVEKKVVLEVTYDEDLENADWMGVPGTVHGSIPDWLYNHGYTAARLRGLHSGEYKIIRPNFPIPHNEEEKEHSFLCGNSVHRDIIDRAIKAERERVLEEKKKIVILGTSRRAGEATSLRYLKQYSDEIDKIINPKE